MSAYHKNKIITLSQTHYVLPQKYVFHLLATTLRSVGESHIWSDQSLTRNTIMTNFSNHIKDADPHFRIDHTSDQTRKNGSKTEHLTELLNRVSELYKTSKNSGETLIVGLSIAQGMEISELRELIPRLKSAYPNMIIVAGGVAVQETDDEYLAELFQLGFDWINIGGIEGFRDWLMQLPNHGGFQRDASGLLHTYGIKNWPKSLISIDRWAYLWKANGVVPDDHVEIEPTLSGKTLLVSLGSHCLAKCNFCAENTKPQPGFLNTIIESRFVNKVRDAIKHYQDQGQEIEWIYIIDPNPLHFPERFESMISRINLPQAKIGLFPALNLFLDPSSVEQLLGYVKKFSIYGITIGRDAVIPENDGDSIGKMKTGKQPFTNQEYQTIRDNIQKFLIRLPDLTTHDDILVTINYLFHPWMTPSEYFMKLEESAAFKHSLSQPGIFNKKIMVSPNAYHTLKPYSGAPLRKGFQNKSLLLIQAQKLIPETIFEQVNDSISVWSQQFQNSSLLDLFVGWKSNLLPFLAPPSPYADEEMLIPFWKIITGDDPSLRAFPLWHNFKAAYDQGDHLEFYLNWVTETFTTNNDSPDKQKSITKVIDYLEYLRLREQKLATLNKNLDNTKHHTYLNLVHSTQQKLFKESLLP